MNSPENFFTPQEVADILKFKVSSIYAALSRGELQGFHQGRRRVITKQQLSDYLLGRNRVPEIDLTYSRERMR